jgi:hypothetical protein
MESNENVWAAEQYGIDIPANRPAAVTASRTVRIHAWIHVQIAGIDPTVPVDIQTLHEKVSSLADRPRFETALLGFFAFTGLLMASARMV